MGCLGVFCVKNIEVKDAHNCMDMKFANLSLIKKTILDIKDIRKQ